MYTSKHSSPTFRSFDKIACRLAHACPAETSNAPRCGYVGIVAARMGAVVTVTDREDHLEHLHANVCRNGFEHTVRVAELEWADPASSGLWDCSYDWVRGLRSGPKLLFALERSMLLNVHVVLSCLHVVG